MSILITLDSSGTDQVSNDFTVSYDRDPIKLYSKEGYRWFVGLVKATGWNSINNIDNIQYNNAAFRWIDELDVVHDFVIPNGTYNIYQLSDAIQENITLQGGTGSNISIVPNFPERRIKIVITQGSQYEVDLSVSNFYKLLGFSDLQALSGNITQTTQGSLEGDITNGIDSLFISCSIASGSFLNSDQANIIYTFVPDVSPGANINIVPFRIQYVSIDLEPGTDYIRDIRMTITDNLGRDVSFNGEDWQYLLSFKLMEV